MLIQFSIESPKWQQEWFKLHWVSYYDKQWTKDPSFFTNPMQPKLEVFCNYLRELNFNSYLDSSGIVCVELTEEEYMLAFCTTN